MKALNPKILLIASLFVGSAFAQTTPPVAPDLPKMEQALKEAGDLQSTQPGAVAEKLTPVLTDLRQLRQKGTLTLQTIKIYQDALLLLMRAQSLLMAPEPEIVASLRELVVVNPKIEDAIFNPREKLLLENLRSAETGRLALQTNPPGCTLTYHGTEWGSTPVDVPLLAGTYTLRLSKQGYLDQEFEITVKPAEILSASRALRRRAVDLLLSVNVSGTLVSLNGQGVGTTQLINAWVASLPADRQQEMGSLVRQWNLDLNTAGFFRLSEIPVGEPVKLEFRAPCYETLNLNLTVNEQEVDWSRPIVLRPELRQVELKRDVGFAEISSTPAGAEAYLDGILLGNTPVGREVCVGTHRIQVLHRSGQYVREVTIRRGLAAKVTGDLKPALAFLGIYAQSPPGTPINLLKNDSEIFARKLALRLTAFSDPQLSGEEIESLRKQGTLPLDRLLDPKTPAADTEMFVKKIASDAGHSNLILLGLRAGDKYLFRLYSTIHPHFDLIEIPDMEDASLEFLVSQFNKAERVAGRLQAASLGVDLLDTPKGLSVTKVESTQSGTKTPLAPGSIIRSVDQKQMSFKELRDYLRSKKPGQSLTLEVVAGKDSVATVPLTLRFSGAEYPWSTPDCFANAVLIMLQHSVERDPLSDEAKFAGLSFARGLMHRGEWKLALEFLAKTNLEPHKSGICPGTVLYYQGRCYEELGDRALAESYYARAKDYPEATIGTLDGLLISGLAERRIQSLKKATR